VALGDGPVKQQGGHPQVPFFGGDAHAETVDSIIDGDKVFPYGRSGSKL